MLLAIALVGWGLRTLFQDHVTQQLQAQLVMQLDHLSASVDWNSPGSGSVSPMAADPRLAQPLSGLYWQIDQLGPAPQAGVARSRSLWDQVLRLPDAPKSYPAIGYSVLPLQDAQGHTLLAVARTLQLPEDDAPLLRLVVAGDKALLAEPLQRFTRMLLIALGLLALGLALAVAVQLQLALRPLQL
ncbi:MAG: ATP-binding protein, partial [Giesbergeria sp.]